MKIKFLIILSFLSLFKFKKDIEIKEDFVVQVDYRYENSNTNWSKRGEIIFTQNKKKNNNIFVNENSKLQVKELKTQCENGNGTYFLRFKSGGNLFFSSIKACEIVENNFKDRIIINTYGVVKKDTIISINYDREIYDDYVSEDKSEGFTTSVRFVENISSSGPNFPEEKEN